MNVNKKNIRKTVKEYYKEKETDDTCTIMIDLSVGTIWVQSNVYHCTEFKSTDKVSDVIGLMTMRYGDGYVLNTKSITDFLIEYHATI